MYDELIQWVEMPEESRDEPGYVVTLRELAIQIFEALDDAKTAIDDLAIEARRLEAPKIEVIAIVHNGYTVLLFYSGKTLLFCSVPALSRVFADQKAAEEAIDALRM